MSELYHEAYPPQPDDQDHCPACGHELDLALPTLVDEANMTSFVVYAPDRDSSSERLRREREKRIAIATSDMQDSGLVEIATDVVGEEFDNKVERVSVA